MEQEKLAATPAATLQTTIDNSASRGMDDITDIVGMDICLAHIDDDYSLTFHASMFT